MYIETRQYGLRGKGFQGESFFTAENPPYGAQFTYYLKDEIKTRKQQRRDAEKEAEKKKAALPYPAQMKLRTEDEEEAPVLLLTVADASGRAIRTLTGPVNEGHPSGELEPARACGAAARPAHPTEADDDLFFEEPAGPLVDAGTLYGVAFEARGRRGDAAEFRAGIHGGDRERTGAEDAARKELFEFQQKVAKLERAVLSALDTANELNTRIGKDQRSHRRHARDGSEVGGRGARPGEKEQRSAARAARR